MNILVINGSPKGKNSITLHTALYLEKKKLSPTARIVLGVLGGAGALFFGWMLYRDGLQFTRIAYLLIHTYKKLLILSFSHSLIFSISQFP